MATVIALHQPPRRCPRLQRLRVCMWLTQAQVGAAVGVDARTVDGWEKGAERIPLRARPVLAELFGVSIDHLLATDEEVT